MSSISVRQVGNEVCVAPQLAPEHMQAVADAGFRSVINNRPDFEGGPDQPTSDAVAAAAKAAKLEYVFLPVNSAMQTAEEIKRFAELLESLPKPILAFCRTGTRSGRLFDAAQALPPQA